MHNNMECEFEVDTKQILAAEQPRVCMCVKQKRIQIGLFATFASIMVLLLLLNTIMISRGQPGSQSHRQPDCSSRCQPSSKSRRLPCSSSRCQLSSKSRRLPCSSSRHQPCRQPGRQSRRQPGRQSRQPASQ